MGLILTETKKHEETMIHSPFATYVQVLTVLRQAFLCASFFLSLSTTRGGGIVRRTLGFGILILAMTDISFTYLP